MEALKIEPLKLKAFAEGLVVETGGRPKGAFVPNGKKPQEEEAPPPPTYSEADLKAAERDGYQKGFLQGVKEGRQQAENEQAETNRQLAAMTEQFEASIRPIFEHYRAFSAAVQQEMAKVAMAIAKKVAGPALEENAHLLIADIATRACESMMNEAKLTITAHESLGDALQGMLQGIASRLPEHTEIVILRDPAMPKADCRIDWKLGCMEHSVQELWKRVEKAVENLSATATREGAEDLQRLEQAVMQAEPAPPGGNEEQEAQQDQDSKE